MNSPRLMATTASQLNGHDTALNHQEVVDDYKLAYLSRQLSLAGRKDVHSGRAKFGIFGDGKEIAQIVYAKFFQKGDWRSGYYRDQSFMLAAGLLSSEEFFAQLYGSTDENLNPSTAGRNFNNHFSTKNINSQKEWVNLTATKNSSSDISPTAGQMPRLLGLAYASKLFRNNKALKSFSDFSKNGNEIAFGMIGEASTSEGMFFETINAACVLQVPMAIAIWDDGFGISVPVELQSTKASISKALKGFEKEHDTNGCYIYTARGWDYPQLVKIFGEGLAKCRKEHVPVVFHITEMTQPFGHSSSGSHERYKTPERLHWEIEYDPITKMREWMLEKNIVEESTLNTLETEISQHVKDVRQVAWDKYIGVYNNEKADFVKLIDDKYSYWRDHLDRIAEYKSLLANHSPARKDILCTAKRILFALRLHDSKSKSENLANWINAYQDKCNDIYNTKLYSETHETSSGIKPLYASKASMVSGREIINRNFDMLFQKYPLLVTFGEDTGKLGDVNQSLRGLQQKYGDLRVTDTGIREPTIIGQGIGLALRGFRPIAEIQYLDYLVYAIPTLTDDLATLHYRTNGNQVAPLIIRTRGHRLVGMWHSGSPLGMMINTLQGINICVPRNMTKAAGFYNTLLKQNDPAIVIEPLKGYEQQEILPENMGEFCEPLGIPEIIQEGTDVTLVTYGWCVEIAKEAAVRLQQFDISVEIIDVQTLIPFDVTGIVKKSIMKTSNVLFLDEDIPGGGTASMMKKVVDEQDAFYYLDTKPRAISASEHRSAYDTDGDYFSKPSVELIMESIMEIVEETSPGF